MTRGTPTVVYLHRITKWAAERDRRQEAARKAGETKRANREPKPDEGPPAPKPSLDSDNPSHLPS